MSLSNVCIEYPKPCELCGENCFTKIGKEWLHQECYDHELEEEHG